MNYLDRYIFRSIIVTTLLVLLLLLSLQTLVGFVFELEAVGRGNYTISLAALYVLLKIPGHLYEFFPSAVLIGSLLGLGALASNSELVVMRTSGVSTWRLLSSVLQTGLFLAVIVTLIGEYWAPKAELYSQQMRLTAQSKNVSLKSKEALWVRNGQRYINVQKVLPGVILRNVTVYEYEQENLQRVIHADLVRPLPDDSWQLNNLTYTEVTANSSSQRTVEREIWRDLIDRSLFDLLSVKSRSQSASYLYNYVNYLKKNQLDSKNYELEFWRRISVPFSIIVMLTLSLPFVFQSNRSSKMGQQLVIGIILGVVYILVENLVGRMGLVYGLPPFASAFLPPLAFLAMAAYGIRRVG